jgi:hypothetical protein
MTTAKLSTFSHIDSYLIIETGVMYEAIKNSDGSLYSIHIHVSGKDTEIKGGNAEYILSILEQLSKGN